MIFCIENADKCEEIVQMLSQSVDATLDVPLNKIVIQIVSVILLIDKNYVMLQKLFNFSAQFIFN